jgi:hypothetical protein
VVNWRWLPMPWNRIVEPYLSSLGPDERQRVETGLEAIRQDPYASTTFPWKGRSPAVVPQTTRMAIIEGPRDDVLLQVIYAPYVDYPLLGPIAILELEAGTASEGNGAE